MPVPVECSAGLLARVPSGALSVRFKRLPPCCNVGTLVNPEVVDEPRRAAADNETKLRVGTDLVGPCTVSKHPRRVANRNAHLDLEQTSFQWVFRIKFSRYNQEANTLSC